MLIKFAYKINNSPLVIIYMNPKKKKDIKQIQEKRKIKGAKKIMMRRGRAKRGGGGD